ncbi:MAG: tripartite tricarboxylate transporter substrate binding protein [Acetobacteraceae bacterium]|nr:tripartite tricarboxylate transporter substrate binding protein [Acetobacteraceae bacterium]
MSPTPNASRRALLAAAATLPFTRPALAQAPAWPGTRPVRLVTPATLGHPGDTYARLLAEHCARTLGGTFLVDNRPGATGSIATGYAAQQPPDGWTFLTAANTSHVVAPLLLRGLSFDPVRDFTSVAAQFRYGMILIVANRVPARTVPEFVAWAKAQPRGTSMASVGIGSVGHLTAERFRQMADFPAVHVPYRGAAPAMVAMTAGESDWVFDSIGNSAELLRSGKVRGLALTGPERSAVMPEYPTLAEVGFPGLLEEVWFGLWTPAGTPRPIIERMNAANNAWLDLPDTKTRFHAGAHTAMAGTPEDMDRIWAADRERWTALIRQVGVRME